MNTMTLLWTVPLTPPPPLVFWFPNDCSEKIKTISKAKWAYHLEGLGMRLDGHFLWQTTGLWQLSFPHLLREMGRVSSTVSC